MTDIKQFTNQFKPKFFIKMVLVFIAATIIGTLTHELGHCTMATFLGHDSKLKYASCVSSPRANPVILETLKNHSNEITSGIDFDGKQKYESIRNQIMWESTWVTMAGPLQTLLIGTLGFILLLIYHSKNVDSQKFSFTGWLLVFLSLFWIRQVFIFALSFSKFIYSGELKSRIDEIRIAHFFEINPWSIVSLTSAIGLIISIITIKLIPKRLVFTFLSAGFFGGISGLILWFRLIGPIILP